MRLIDADNLTNKAEILYRFTSSGKITPWSAVRVCEINNIKTVDAEPVRHGQWATDAEDIEWGNSLKRKYCTNCGKRPHFDKEEREFVLTNYCPHCGAKMDGGK